MLHLFGLSIDPQLSVGDIVVSGVGMAILGFAWKASAWASRMDTRVEGTEDEIGRLRTWKHSVVEPFMRSTPRGRDRE